MSNIPQLVQVTVSEHTTSLLSAIARLPFIPYEERFERKGKWLLGPRILAKICRHMEGKSLVMTVVKNEPTRPIVSLPEFPKVYDKLYAEEVSLYWLVPEELRATVEVCCWEALSYRDNDITLLREQMIGMYQTQDSIHQANYILRQYEMARIAKQDPTDPPLWECLANRFGLSSLFVQTAPEPFVNGTVK